MPNAKYNYLQSKGGLETFSSMNMIIINSDILL